MAPEKPKLVHGQTEDPPAPPEQSTAASGVTRPDVRPTRGLWLDESKRSYVTLFLLTLGALYAAYLIYRPFLKSLFLALVLTIAFLPIHEWVSRRVRRPTMAALITSLAVVLLIMTPLMFISRGLVSQATNLYTFVTQEMSGTWSGHFGWANDAVERM